MRHMNTYAWKCVAMGALGGMTLAAGIIGLIALYSLRPCPWDGVVSHHHYCVEWEVDR